MEKKKGPKKSKTSIYLPEEIFWRLKELAVERRMGDNDAMVEAVTEWTERELAKAKAGAPKGKRA